MVKIVTPSGAIIHTGALKTTKPTGVTNEMTVTPKPVKGGVSYTVSSGSKNNISNEDSVITSQKATEYQKADQPIVYQKVEVANTSVPNKDVRPYLNTYNKVGIESQRVNLYSNINDMYRYSNEEIMSRKERAEEIIKSKSYYNRSSEGNIEIKESDITYNRYGGLTPVSVSKTPTPVESVSNEQLIKQPEPSVYKEYKPEGFTKLSFKAGVLQSEGLSELKSSNNLKSFASGIISIGGAYALGVPLGVKNVAVSAYKHPIKTAGTLALFAVVPEAMTTLFIGQTLSNPETFTPVGLGKLTGEVGTFYVASKTLKSSSKGKDNKIIELDIGNRGINNYGNEIEVDVPNLIFNTKNTYKYYMSGSKYPFTVKDYNNMNVVSSKGTSQTSFGSTEFKGEKQTDYLIVGEPIKGVYDIVEVQRGRGIEYDNTLNVNKLEKQPTVRTSKSAAYVSDSLLIEKGYQRQIEPGELIIQDSYGNRQYKLVTEQFDIMKSYQERSLKSELINIAQQETSQAFVERRYDPYGIYKTEVGYNDNIVTQSLRSRYRSDVEGYLSQETKARLSARKLLNEEFGVPSEAFKPFDKMEKASSNIYQNRLSNYKELRNEVMMQEDIRRMLKINELELKRKEPTDYLIISQSKSFKSLPEFGISKIKFKEENIPKPISSPKEKPIQTIIEYGDVKLPKNSLYSNRKLEIDQLSMSDMFVGESMNIKRINVERVNIKELNPMGYGSRPTTGGNIFNNLKPITSNLENIQQPIQESQLTQRSKYDAYYMLENIQQAIQESQLTQRLKYDTYYKLENMQQSIQRLQLIQRSKYDTYNKLESIQQSIQESQLIQRYKYDTFTSSSNIIRPDTKIYTTPSDPWKRLPEPPKPEEIKPFVFDTDIGFEKRKTTKKNIYKPGTFKEKMTSTVETAVFGLKPAKISKRMARTGLFRR